MLIHTRLLCINACFANIIILKSTINGNILLEIYCWKYNIICLYIMSVDTFLDFREGDILHLTYLNSSFKGVCISMKKNTFKFLIRFQEVKVIYDFFYTSVCITKVIRVNREKKSYFLIDNFNKKYRRLYSGVL